MTRSPPALLSPKSQKWCNGGSCQHWDALSALGCPVSIFLSSASHPELLLRCQFVSLVCFFKIVRPA